MSLTIAGIGTASPEYSITQDDVAEVNQSFCHGDEKKRRVIPALYRRAGVRKRHSVLLRRPEGADLELAGEILRVAPVVDTRTGTVKVTCRVGGASEFLRPGSFVRVKVQTDLHQQVLVIPKRALVPEGGDFEITTDRGDPEIAEIAGPQLVVPVSNARFALNAANARWGNSIAILTGDLLFGAAFQILQLERYHGAATRLRQMVDGSAGIGDILATSTSPLSRNHRLGVELASGRAWADIEGTIDTNLLGVIRGSVVALRGMREQERGWIFNMEGFGSEGMIGLEQLRD